MLLEMLLGKPREYLLAHDDEPLSEQQFERYTRFLGLRSQGHPMAYLVGKREFFSLKFCGQSRGLNTEARDRMASPCGYSLIAQAWRCHRSWYR